MQEQERQGVKEAVERAAQVGAHIRSKYVCRVLNVRQSKGTVRTQRAPTTWHRHCRDRQAGNVQLTHVLPSVCLSVCCRSCQSLQIWRHFSRRPLPTAYTHISRPPLRYVRSILREVSQRLTGTSQQVPSSAPAPPFPPAHTPLANTSQHLFTRHATADPLSAHPHPQPSSFPHQESAASHPPAAPDAASARAS